MKSRLEQLLDELLRQIDIPAMEQAMSKQYKSQIRRRWELPADYWMLLERCCGLRTVWSNDTYEALELWGLDTLMKGQEGYAYNPVEQKVIKDWDEHLVVIASDAGDPYCLDLRRNDTAVFWAEHGAGTWDFQPAFDCLEDFLESVLDVPKTQEYETAYLTARSDMVDEYHKDGIAAGFLLYPLSGFTGEERVKAILDFRDNLRDAILRDAGEEAVTFLGGATGLYCGYLDFIAWDLPAVLTAAQAFFEGSDLPYYTLVTMGMGAHRMNVPEELAEYKLERAELAIALPPDWKLDEESLKDERWYWPIGLLKVLARLPISNDTWLGFGHTMDKQSPFAEDTELCAALLVGPQDVVWNGGEVCTLPSGEEVNFYQVIPLYRNEMEYKMEHDADALLKKMAGISFVVNPTRQNAITRGTLAEEEFTGDMDDAAWHLESIQEKGLPVNEINAYNHMAIYLRWCIEHDLMSAEFMERYWEQVQPFMADLSRADLRGFIRDQLKGQLFGALFNKEGAAFAGYYYGEADSPYFPSDIDNYALEYFGSEQYYSDKFQDEAYLFIPFDENYYQAIIIGLAYNPVLYERVTAACKNRAAPGAAMTGKGHNGTPVQPQPCLRSE